MFFVISNSNFSINNNTIIQNINIKYQCNHIRPGILMVSSLVFKHLFCREIAFKRTFQRTLIWLIIPVIRTAGFQKPRLKKKSAY